MREKVVGILGGMGPYATVDLFRKIIEQTPARKDWEHLRIIVDNNPKIPSRTRAVLFHEENPIPMLVETAKNLEKAGADFIVIPCNSAHLFYPELSRKIKIPILNMIDETVEYMIKKRPDIKTAGLLAAKIVVDAGLYQNRLKDKRVITLVPTEEQEKIVREVIEDVKLNKTAEEVRLKLTQVTDALIQKGAEAIIAGCTEISIILKESHLAVPLFDSNAILAEAAVRKARDENILKEKI